MKRYIPILICILCIEACTQKTNYPWFTGSFNDAKANATEKLIMLDFYATWWGGCNLLDADTFSNPEVAQHAAENLISIKIDVDKKEGSELFSTFNGTVMPTLIFLDSSGNEIDRIIGYLPPEQYQSRVTEIQNNVNTLGACIQKYGNGERTAHLLFTIAQKYTDRNESENAEKYYKL